MPHGIKVALVLAHGLRAAPAIFAGMFAINLFSADSLNIDSLMIPGAIIGTVCVIVPLIFHNLSSRKSIFAAPMFDGVSNQNNLWLFLSFAFASSVLNSLANRQLIALTPPFCPDVSPWGPVGTVSVFIVLVFLVRPVLINILRKEN